MKQIGDVIIDCNRVTSPRGQYPLNVRSAVWVRLIHRSQVTKKAIVAGLTLAAIFTGGISLLLAVPAGAMFAHESFEVVLSTDGVEFVIAQFNAAVSILKNKQSATELKDAIAEAIEECPQ